MADKIPFAPVGTSGTKTSTTKTTGKIAFAPTSGVPGTTAPAAKKPTGPDPLGSIVNFGKAFFGALGTGGAWVEGYLTEAAKQSGQVSQGKQALDWGKIFSKNIESANKNATAWTRDEQTTYGTELLQELAKAKITPTDLSKKVIWDVPILGKIDAIGLGLDIALDPLNLVPGKVFTTPLKATAVGTKSFIKQAKLANAGQVSEKVATNVAEGAIAKTLKPGALAVEQFTKRPLIKPENIRPTGPLAERLAKTEKTIVEGPKVGGVQFPSLLYKTVATTGRTPLNQVIASGLEAGAKASAAVVLGEIAQRSLSTLAKAERSAAKRAGSATRALINGEFQDLAPFEPHVAPDATYVVDADNIVHTFDNADEATAWVQKQKDSTAPVNVTVGDKPVMDTPLTGITPQILAKLPTNSKEAKSAQKSLNEIQKIAQQTTGVTKKGVERSYENFNAFVAGLKVGDQIDYSVLEKIVKVLDPENKLVAKLEKAAASKNSYKLLKQALISEGPQTVYETQNRINMINANTTLKATGLGNAEAAATYAQNRLDGTADANPVALSQSRDRAQVKLFEAKKADGKMVDDVLYAINQGFARILARAYDIMSSPDAIKEATNQGKLAILSSEAKYASNQKAQLVKEFNQYGEVRVLGNLFGIMRKRTSDTQLSVDDFIVRSETLNDALLAGLGIRNVYSKSEALAKGIPHFVYLSMHDFALTLQSAGYEKVLKRALFPDTAEAGIKKTDTLSTASIGEAMRMVLEAKERGIKINIAELEAQLIRRGEGQVLWSKEYSIRAPKIAKQVAAAITDPAVVAQFERAHIARSLAAIEDNIASSETLSESLFTTMLDGWKANLGLGIDTLAARDQLVRDLFNEFVYTAGIFKQQNGDVAQATFQSAAMMFLNGGKLRDLVDPSKFTDLIPDGADAASRQAYADMTEAINSFFKQQNSSQYAAAGRELLPFPSDAVRDTVIKRLTAAKAAYRQHVIDGEALTTAAELKTWRTKMKGFQKDLDEARQLAWKNSIPTHHWQNGRWVPSETYSRRAALKEARDLGKDVIRTPQGMLNRADDAIDTIATFPSHKRMTAEQSRKWLANWRAENNVRAVDAQEGVRQEAAKFIVDNEEAFDALGLTPLEKAQRMIQQEHAEALDGLKITVLEGAAEYKPRSLKNLNERLNATSGRWNLKGLLNKAESTILTNSADVADFAHSLRNTYIKEWRKISKSPEWRAANIPANATAKEANEIVLQARQDVFKKAFGYAIDRVVPENESAIVTGLTAHLRSMFDTLFGNPENAAITKNGIDPKMLSAAFAKFGLSDKIGFVSPGTLNPSQLADYLKWLPFGNAPENLTATQKAVWDARAATFAESGEDPFILVTRLAQAIQFARSEKGIVHDFATQFGYKAQGLTFKQAVEQGWVQIKGQTMAGTNLSDHLPLPEDGGLYPPNLAEEFLSINREWNKLYNSPEMPKALRTMMEIQGFFKATQTIFTARHHITNAFGDTTTAFIGGTRNPVHWAQGLRMALAFAGEDAASQWGRNKLDYKFVQMFKGNEGYGRVVGLAKGDDPLKVNPAITISKNGKLVNVPLDIESLIAEFKSRGIMVGNIFSNDIQGLSDSVLADLGSLGERKTLMGTVGSRVKEAWREVEKPLGSFASYYGNVPRAAHALQVMQSRSWSSLEEALNAASQKVSTYHPTIQSLSASERRGPRLMFTYYTWLRVAHNAFIDMALNHTAAMMVPSKIQYNLAEQQGLEPTSFGDPWSNELKMSSPTYLNYSVYGPTTAGEQGPMLFKRSILPMDILDTWTFAYDPAYSLDENLFNFQRSGPNSPIKTLTKTLLKNINLPAQAILEPGLGVDASGAPTKIKDFPTWFDSQINKIGPVSVLKGYGIIGSLKETTPEERQLKIDNFWTGQKGQVILSDANKKNAKKERNLRKSGSVVEQSFSDFLKTYKEGKK